MTEQEARKRMALALPHLGRDERVVVERALFNLARPCPREPRQAEQPRPDLRELVDPTYLKAGGSRCQGQTNLLSGRQEPQQ